ncbi:MAG: sterol desaturase family protein [Pseudomonadota bacterium]
MEFLTGTSGLFVFFAVLAAAMAIERLAPWRRAPVDIARWTRNGLMSFYAAVILGLLPFLSAAGAALAAQARGAGLLHQIDAPLWVGVLGAVVILDLVAFLQHRALHRFYFLWRTHRTHHTDAAIDATTALRFHPLETVFRAATEAPVIFALGLPLEGVLMSYAAFLAANMFTHANIRLPARIERALSLIIITPRAHRLHHAANEEFRESNFGTIFSVWDRIAGVFKSPGKLHTDEVFGVTGPEAMEAETFANMALDPFRRRPPEAPIASGLGEERAPRSALED